MIEQKRVMRESAKVLRDGMDPAVGALLAVHLMRESPPPEGAIVAGFWPIGTEIDIRPLLLALHARGHKVLLPVTGKRGERLIFRQWDPAEALIAEKFGTFRPTGDIAEPHWLLVPLLAFDRLGRRLGYGGGFYDRTLRALPDATAIGCAYAAQEVVAVPEEGHDARLRAVATELGLISCRTN